MGENFGDHSLLLQVIQVLVHPKFLFWLELDGGLLDRGCILNFQLVLVLGVLD